VAPKTSIRDYARMLDQRKARATHDLHSFLQLLFEQNILPQKTLSLPQPIVPEYNGLFSRYNLEEISLRSQKLEEKQKENLQRIWNFEKQQKQQQHESMDIVIEEEEKESAEVLQQKQRQQQLLIARKMPLNEQEKQRICVLLSGPPNETILIDKFSIDMTRYKLSCLRPGTWLNDEVVNFYMSMLQERDLQLVAQNVKRLSSHYFNSFFISKLLEQGKYSYNNVRRWTKKFNILEKEKIFCPVNISNTHWTLAVIYMQQQEIHYYDSMSSSGEFYLQALKKWVYDDVLDKQQQTLDMSSWKLLDRMSHVPQQRNGFDCGMFAITHADYLADDLPLEFSQEEMVMRRMKVASMILQGSIEY
jgi:Ulp1 family protease